MGSNTTINDAWKDFTPKANPPSGNAHLAAAEEVRTGLTDDELRTMAKEKLSALLQGVDAKTQPSLLLSVARELLDRIEGKPTQRILQKVEHTRGMASTDLTNEQLLMMLRQADVAGLLPAGTKLVGERLVVDAEYETLDVVTPATNT